MSEDNKIPPPPPPDDFTKTTPNIRVPDRDDHGGDWDAPDRNIPKPAPDDWGKTILNIKPIDTGSDRTPSTPEWGMTETNINVNAADLGTAPEDFAPRERMDKTMPYFQLPEAERAKYQKLPPTPTEAAEQAQQEDKGGIPNWVWAAAGLMAMFFFAIVVLAAVYLIVLRDTSYVVKVIGAPAGSTVQVDGSPLGVTDENGSIRLENLKAGDHEISIVHPTYTCDKQMMKGGNGDKLKEMTARCKAIPAAPTDDCANIHVGEDDKAERCYNTALDSLSDPFTPEDLIKALNILVVNFASGSSQVPTVRLAALQKGAGFIKKLPPSVILEIGGHTDNVGGAAYNQKLSEDRAASVKEVLVKYGVRPEALQTRGYGMNKPITTNSTEDGKYRNRRIEYSIVQK
ncbi:MAG: OmpA family protein [Acidobacteria bacterium]|nr:OmpA family protein [Acidobacteriota bacterium]